MKRIARRSCFTTQRECLWVLRSKAGGWWWMDHVLHGSWRNDVGWRTVICIYLLFNGSLLFSGASRYQCAGSCCWSAQLITYTVNTHNKVGYIKNAWSVRVNRFLCILLNTFKLFCGGTFRFIGFWRQLVIISNPGEGSFQLSTNEISS